MALRRRLRSYPDQERNTEVGEGSVEKPSEKKSLIAGSTHLLYHAEMVTCRFQSQMLVKVSFCFSYIVLCQKAFGRLTQF